MQRFLITVVLIIIMAVVSYGLWMLGKWVNYTLFYESSVTETVRLMVKPECIRGDYAE